MIRRVYRCTLHPTQWHWEVVRHGEVIESGYRFVRSVAWRVAGLMRDAYVRDEKGGQ